jgi:hypothetical protein
VKYRASAVERIPSEQHPLHPLAVAAPLFDLVEIAMIRDQRLVGLLVRPVVHEAVRGNR